MNKIDRLFYKPEELLQVIPMSRSGIYKAIASGHIESVKIGRRILIPVAVIEKLAQSHSKAM